MRDDAKLHRRGFLGAAAAATAVGGLARPARAVLLKGAPGEIGETPHFQYYLAPEGPYIDSQRDDRAFGFKGDRIFLSEDRAKTWSRSTPFPDAENITFSCFLGNGNIVFATRANLFLSDDGLKTFKEIVVKDREGRDYRPHKPKNPDLPGWYFHPLDGVHTWDVDGREMLVWGNYCNVEGGAVPVNVFYSVDGGETVKLAYSFGRNPSFQEPGAEPDSFLGDPTNPIIARHVHCVAYNPAENAFYACTGDIDRDDHGHEVHWLRGRYDAGADSWEWRILKSVNSNSRYKSGGFNFVGDQMYWAADANGAAFEDGTYDRGVFRCAPADAADPSKHVKLFDAPFEMANMLIQDGVIFAGHCAPASTLKTGIAYSPDMGATWVEYDLAEYGPRSPLRFQRKNSDGWFRMDLRKGWISRADVLFLKPKA